MRLDKQLAKWREAALLSADQVQAIRDFEQRRRGNAGTWVVIALGAVGGLAVVTGIISLIAANWDEIPPALKLGGTGALLAGSAVAAHRLSRRVAMLASDLLLVVHAGLVLAMIGVVAQVYNLSGAPWRPLALATALALPAAAISDRSLLSDVVTIGAVATLGTFLSSSPEAAPYLEGFGWPLLGASIGGALLLLADAVRRLHPPATPALRRWGAALIVTVVVVAAARWSIGWDGRTRLPAQLVCAGIAGAWIARLAWRRQTALAVAAFALAALVFGAAFVHAPTYWRLHSPGAGIRFMGFALFCTSGAAFAIAAAQAGSRRLTNLFTLAIAARVVVLFLEVVSSLALTGFGLLLTGAVFCGVAWAWWKLHGALPVYEGSREP